MSERELKIIEAGKSPFGWSAVGAIAKCLFHGYTELFGSGRAHSHNPLTSHSLPPPSGDLPPPSEVEVPPLDNSDSVPSDWDFSVEVGKTHRSKALDFGTQLHACLAQMYAVRGDVAQTLSGGPYLPWTDLPFLTSGGTVASADGANNREKLIRLMANYQLYWYAEDQQLQVGGVEQVLTHEDLPGYTQRADLIALHSGKYWIIDHKTTYRLTKSSAAAFEMDGQFIGYHWFGKRLFGDRFGGVLANFISKEDKEPLKIFARQPVHVSAAQLRAFPHTVRFAQRMYQEWSGLSGPPDNAVKGYANCTSKFGQCKHWNLCKEGA